MAVTIPADVSCDELMGDPGSEGGMQLPEGLSVMIDRLVGRLRDYGVEFRYSQQVKQVRQHRDGVEIEFADGRIVSAKAVLITASLGVLAGKEILFTPDLPADVAARFSDAQMGCMTKISLALSQEFVVGNRLIPDSHIDFAHLAHPAYCQVCGGGSRTLNLLVGGEQALEVEELPDDEALEFACAILDQSPLLEGYRQAIAGPAIVTRWNTDPFTKGSYSTLYPHRKRSDPILFERVLFAGEAWVADPEEAAGSMVGAYFSGLRAAALLSNLLQPDG